MVSTVSPKNITTATMESVVDQELKLLYDKCANSDEREFGWRIVRILSFQIDVFDIKPLRASSYITAPESYASSMCGLINIRNTDNECFKWCMLYHQSDKSAHVQRTTSLKKVGDKYCWNGVEFPSSYGDICKFEELSPVRVFAYVLAVTAKTVRFQFGRNMEIRDIF